MPVTITPDSLNKSFQTYRQQLIVMPFLDLASILQYMTIRPGVRYKETVGELTGDWQMAPYKKTRMDNTDMSIKGRELETFFGNAVKGFDPNSVVQSIWGSNSTKGDALKSVPITLQVCAYLMKKLSEHIGDEMFTAVRNATGDTTHDLFNGFDTIRDTEITGGAISTEEKNLFDMSATEAITKANAEDAFKDYYWSAAEKLRGQNVNLYCNPFQKHLYEESYQLNHGSLPYNQQFEKSVLEGTNGKCNIVPLNCIPLTSMYITTKSNLLVGTCAIGDYESFVIEKSLTSHFDIDFVATMFWGCQFESINKEMLHCAKFKAA